jgi:hypothetical protein
MARSKIASTSKDVITDDGSVLISVAKGEQLHIDIQFNWLTNLTGYTITAKVIEGVNVSGAVPTAIKVGGVTTDLVVIDPVVTDNMIILVIPQTLVSSYAPQPTPTASVFAFVDLEIADAGIGPAQQIWKPMRGLVEISYSPTDI